MATLKIIAGTVYGNAQHVAEQVEENLAEQGVDCLLESDPSVADFTEADALLIITSTMAIIIILIFIIILTIG